ncbi:MAG: hypothetical protein U0521_20995 [Anaerolineae bacterium]
MAILIAAAVGVYAAPVSQAQPGTQLSAILYFMADIPEVDYQAMEAGTAQDTLYWQTINTDDRYQLTLDRYYQNAWVPALAPDEVLPMSGSKQIVVTTPGTYGYPTYRLTLRNPSGDVVEQQFVVLSYMYVEEGTPPHIVSFTTEAQSVDTNLLIQNNVRLVVHWQIENRAPDTLLRFDQVLADGSTITAELPRRILWVPSSGTGAVVPRPTTSKADLVFRLSLVTAYTGEVVDHMDLVVPVTGNVVVAIPAGVERAPMIAASSQQVTRGGSVVLSWDAGDAASVDLLQTSTTGPTTLYIVLPASGSMTVNVPPDSEGVTYTLRAYSASGEMTTEAVNVAPAEGSGG